MSLALFTIYLIFRMHGIEAVAGLCKTSERSVPGKALKGHTFKEFAVRAIVECQNTCENDPRCASYNYYIPDKVCELNSQTKETRTDDFVTDELRFYMRRDGMMYSVPLRSLRLNCLHCNAKCIRYDMIVNGTERHRSLTTRSHTSNIAPRSVWSKDFQFRDKRGAASLSYRNCTEITLLMCQQKPYPVLWFSVSSKKLSGMVWAGSQTYLCSLSNSPTFPSISYCKWNVECRCACQITIINNEVCHILVLWITCRKKSSTQICITYLNLEKTHIFYVVCFMLFVDDDECLKTPPVCDINANCKNTLGSYLCSCKEGFKGDGKTCQGKIKKKHGTIRKTPHVTYWSKNFYIEMHDPHPFNFQRLSYHK